MSQFLKASHYNGICLVKFKVKEAITKKTIGLNVLCLVTGNKKHTSIIKQKQHK